MRVSHFFLSVMSAGSVLALSACSSLPADMGKSQYAAPEFFCQCGNYRTALEKTDPRRPLGSACHCDPSLGVTTGTVVQR